MTPTSPDARRWQLIAYVSLALLLGYIAGQLSPVAGAQSPQPTPISTVGCRSYGTNGLDHVPNNSIVTATYTHPTVGQMFIYTFCL
jgi:hypothetical protein